MSQIIGVIDEPVAPGSTDNLDLKIHSKSLIDFVQQTNTPITVGIQGEWGSGKTSLLNSIYHAYTSESTFKQIWINSWEYSLLSTPEEALLKIINKIIDELLDSDVDVKRRDTIRDGAKKIFRGALRIGAQVALGDDAAKVTDELMGSSKQSITSLREHLKNLVSDIAQRPTNPYKKIIIYVDDLDRIEPKNAVAILELLKNIFSVPNCVFILAIDYQVVVKGLEHKYGKQTHENEWEFRAFFDKIIQLPFMMPMGQYNIGKYVNALLVEIGFVEGDGLEDEAVREIIRYTIGGNPRSIKRLVNSVSLIQIFVNNKKELSKEEVDEDQKEEGISDRDEKFLLFSLLCLQIAFPPIYSLLVQEPDFIKWDDALAFGTTKRSEEKDEAFKGEFENAQKTDDFNEEWEKVLYRICYERPRLKPRVADISKFFSYIKDELLAERQEIIGETIARLLTQTSVTSVTSSDQGQESVPSAKSKWATEEQVSELSEFRQKILGTIKNAGSVVYGARNPGKSFAWYMRFKSKKDFFSDPKFIPRWEMWFFGRCALRVDGEGTDDNIELLNFFESKFDYLNSEIQSSYGEWEIYHKQGTLRKWVSFYRGDWVGEKEKQAGGAANIIKDEEFTTNCVDWCEYVIPRFEKLIKEIVEEYIEINGKILTSQQNYSG